MRMCLQKLNPASIDTNNYICRTKNLEMLDKIVKPKTWLLADEKSSMIMILMIIYGHFNYTNKGLYIYSSYKS